MTSQEFTSGQPLNVAIDQAIADPMAANLPQLLKEFDYLISQLPRAAQLRVAGEILSRLAEIIAARARRLFDEWEEQYIPLEEEEPVLTVAMLQEVLRQSMTLHLDEFVEHPVIHRTFVPTESIVGEVEKSNLLEFAEMLDQEQAMEEALSLAHQEDVSAWIQAIQEWMQREGKEVSLLVLQKMLKKPLIELWLGLLLGGFALEQRGEFYQTEGIWVQKY